VCARPLEFRCLRPVHSSRRKFFIRIQFKKATTIAAKSADRNTFRTLYLRARPERLFRWTLVPAANTICRMLMEIRNEPLNHRPFALRTDAWFAHIRLPYRIAANHGNVFLSGKGVGKGVSSGSVLSIVNIHAPRCSRIVASIVANTKNRLLSDPFQARQAIKHRLASGDGEITMGRCVIHFCSFLRV
jgi:hypothetical protein